MSERQRAWLDCLRVRYEVDGRVENERGQQVLVFARDGGGGWRAVWRMKILVGATAPS